MLGYRWLIGLSLLLLYLFPGSLAGQALVQGVVREAVGGEPVPGVHVVFAGSQGTITGADGFYSLSLPAGETILSFRFVGFRTVNRSVTVADGETIAINVEMEDEVTDIGGVVVTAGRRAQRLSDLTVSMTVIQPYLIGRNHFVSADEMLNRMPGIEILDGQASVRGGSGYSYGAGSRLLALIDGMPVLSADAGNIKWNTLPLENISRIELIKGASSVLYGSSALNGVVNFISREPGPSPYTEFTATTGIYDTPRRSEWKWWDEPRLSSSLSFAHNGIYNRTGVGVGIKLLTDNGYRRLDDERYARISLRLGRSGDKIRGLRYGLNISSTFTEKRDFLLWEDAWEGALRQSSSTAMEFRGANISLDPYLSFRGKGDGSHRISGRYMANLNRLPENENNNSDSHSLYTEYQYSYSGSDMVTIVSGISQQYSSVVSQFYGDHSGLNVALYTQVEAEPVSRLRAVAGFRLEQYIMNGEAEKLIPVFRTGINATITSNTFLRASFGQGYRYPSVAEKSAYTTVGSIRILPSSEIRAERGWSSEVGLKQAFSASRLTGYADIALFHSRNSDMIEYQFGIWYDPVDGTFPTGFRPSNIENSTLSGFEAEMMASYERGGVTTAVTAGYIFMYPVETGVAGLPDAKRYLKFRRKHSGSLSVVSRAGRFEVGTNITARSALLDIDAVFLDESTREQLLPGFYDYWMEHNTGHLIADLFAGMTISSRYRLSVGVKNLTNTEYMGRPGDIRPHRQYTLQLTGRFY